MPEWKIHFGFEFQNKLVEKCCLDNLYRATILIMCESTPSVPFEGIHVVDDKYLREYLLKSLIVLTITVQYHIIDANYLNHFGFPRLGVQEADRQGV